MSYNYFDTRVFGLSLDFYSLRLNFLSTAMRILHQLSSFIIIYISRTTGEQLHVDISNKERVNRIFKDATYS